MPAGPVDKVDRALLEPLLRVGDGGQGIVYFTDRVWINKTWRAAYKEYLPGTTFSPDMLCQMVAFVPELDDSTGRWLCEATSWPAALVVTGDRVTGFLMRRIPDRFRRPWGKNGAEVPASLQYLLNPQAYLNRIGIELDTDTRLQLLGSIADVIARLHSLGVVVGDLSPNNLLVDLDDPGCFLIDCDGMRLRDQDVLSQVETPEWHVPRPGCEPVATPASDSYKFGLLAARLFAQEQMGRDLCVLAGVSSDLGVLARRSLDTNSTARPSMGDWLGAIQRIQMARALRPTVVSAPSVSTWAMPAPSDEQTQSIPPLSPPGIPMACLMLCVFALLALAGMASLLWMS